MIYSICFKDPKTGEIHRYNGLTYTHIGDAAAGVIYRLCGERPNKWDCRSAAFMLPIFEEALRNAQEQYSELCTWDRTTNEDVCISLGALIARCKQYPKSILEVDW